MKRAEKMKFLGKALDRYESITGKCGHRFDRFIDLDVSKVNAKALAEADDSTLVHDCNGIFENLERDRDEPEKSTLKMFVPRVGFETES